MTPWAPGTRSNNLLAGGFGGFTSHPQPSSQPPTAEHSNGRESTPSPSRRWRQCPAPPAAARSPFPHPQAGDRPASFFCSCRCGGWTGSHDTLILRFIYKEWSQPVTFPWTLPLTKEETEVQGGGVTEA